MSKEDIGRVALGAPALHRVVILTLPDCLLLKEWSRAGATDGEAASAHLGAVYRGAGQALVALGHGGVPQSVTVETEDRLLIVRALSADVAAGFLFDRSAPLGLARVQVQQLSKHLVAMAASLRGSEDLSLTETPDAPAARPTAPPSVRPSPLSSVATLPPLPRPAAPAAPAPIAPAASAPAPAGPTASSPSVSVPTQAPAPADPGRPRVVRLLEFFRRYAPDPHAAMLRLSLRTGISLEALRSPEGLDDKQVDLIATSVSDILGQEQVGV